MRMLLVCTAMVAVVGTATAQPVEWRIEDGGNGHWYELRTFESFRLHPARSQVLSQGGDFVSITSPAENALVSSFVPLAPAVNGLRTFFIGAVRYNAAGCGSYASAFRWVDGSPFVYTQWCGNGNPNCWGEDLVQMPANEGFSDCWGDVYQISGTYGEGSLRTALLEYSSDCNGDGIVDKG